MNNDIDIDIDITAVAAAAEAMETAKDVYNETRVPFAELQRRFVYDPITGVLKYHPGFRLRGLNTKRNLVANRQNPYIRVYVFGINLKGQRVAWALHHGSYATSFIDHWNHCTTDNRIANLRPFSCAQNNANHPIPEGTFAGVRLAGAGRWRAPLGDSQRRGNELGAYECPSMAALVRDRELIRRSVIGTYPQNLNSHAARRTAIIALEIRRILNVGLKDGTCIADAMNAFFEPIGFNERVLALDEFHVFEAAKTSIGEAA